MSEEDKKEIGEILHKSKPEEVDEMISNVERVLRKHHEDIKAETRGETREEIALNAIRAGYDVDDIVIITGLDKSKVINLKNHYIH